MLLVHSLHYPLCSTRRTPKNPRFQPLPSSSHPPYLLQFRRSHRQNIKHLKSLGIAPPSSPESLDWVLSIVAYLKSKGFSECHFPRLSFLCPTLFSSSIDPHLTLSPVFSFLASDLSFSPTQSRDLILWCPKLLVSNVEHRLRPTLLFLRDLGLKNLDIPTNQNAHLLSTPVEELVSKVRSLEELGFSYEEAGEICARCPAVFGYSMENNLRPKVDYLVYAMRRSAEEVKKFPQFFGFSLEKRIAPRHLWLKERGVNISLRRMLLWSDEKFYAKWK
ncbi:transcription termination factor MTEF1, chloroplastic [Typha angustifolia]|uniref:transcription termination factor MTEF1, chloroplastic n=1 Tax=Typha angustifolia TaxID=59011 RepID=UPI003C2AE812